MINNFGILSHLGQKDEICILIFPDGKTEFIGTLRDNHCMALKRYYDRENRRSDFLPNVDPEYLRKTYFNKKGLFGKYKEEFNDFKFSNYLIHLLNERKVIVIKDYTPFNLGFKNIITYLPMDITEEQTLILEDIKDITRARKLINNYILYKNAVDSLYDKKIILTNYEDLGGEKCITIKK